MCRCHSYRAPPLGAASVIVATGTEPLLSNMGGALEESPPCMTTTVHSVTSQWTDNGIQKCECYLERLHAGCREVTLLSIAPLSKPPGLVLLKQDLYQVSLVQVQLLLPAGPVLHHHHHLPITVSKLLPASDRLIPPRLVPH